MVPLGHEPALQAEWRHGQLDGPRWPALLTTRQPLPVVDPAFALQQLPDAHWVRGGSPQVLARAAATHVTSRLEATGAPWQLHSFVPDPQAYRTLVPLVPELAAAFQAELRQVAPGLTGHQAPSGGGSAISCWCSWRWWAKHRCWSPARGPGRCPPGATTSRPGLGGAPPWRTIVGRRPGPTASWWRGSPGWARPRRRASAAWTSGARRAAGPGRRWCGGRRWWRSIAHPWRRPRRDTPGCRRSSAMPSPTARPGRSTGCCVT